MKKLRRNIKKAGMSARAKVGVVAGAMIVGVTNASAAASTGVIDVTGYTPDVTGVFSIAAILLVALGSIWGLKQAIRMAGSK